MPRQYLMLFVLTVLINGGIGLYLYFNSAKIRYYIQSYTVRLFRDHVKIYFFTCGVLMNVYLLYQLLTNT